MYIRVPSSNVEYICELKKQGFYEVEMSLIKIFRNNHAKKKLLKCIVLTNMPRILPKYIINAANFQKNNNIGIHGEDPKLLSTAQG